MLQHNSEKGMSRAEIAQTLILFMTGGTEPTASGMSGVTYNVLSNQRVYTRLVKEVRENFSSDAEVNNVAVNKLPYLNACIKESLRLYPPVPARFPRRTVGGQVVIDGKVIPANVSSMLDLEANHGHMGANAILDFYRRPSMGSLPLRCQLS